MIRDSEKQNCNCILISQNSGIALKNNFEINIHNKNIIIFIHHGNYDIQKIVIACNIIDHLQQFFKFENKTEEEHINTSLLREINNEYQELVQQKLNIIQTIKKTQQDLIQQVQKLDLKNLTSFLDDKFANTGKMAYKCDICNQFNGKNAKALATHKRACKKKEVLVFVET